MPWNKVAVIVILVIMTCAVGEWFQDEMTFEDLGSPTKTYKCTSEDRELVTEISIPFTAPQIPEATTLNIHASSTYAPRLHVIVNGVPVPGERTYSDWWTVRSNFNMRWDLGTHDYNLGKGENTITLRVTQRLDYCEDITIFGNSFVLVQYTRDPTPTPTPEPTVTTTPVPSEIPWSSPTTPPPAATATVPPHLRLLDVGERCADDSRCASGNCIFVCCLEGHICCLSDAHCLARTRCDTTRYYCVPSEDEDAGAFGSFLEPIYITADILETGLFFAAIAVGIWYYNRERKWGRRH